MKKYLSTGFIILLPIALTSWVVLYLFDIFTTPLYHSTESLVMWIENEKGLPLPHSTIFITLISRCIALLLTFLLILLLGFLGRRFFFSRLLNFTQEMLLRVPIIGMIYRLIKDVAQAFFSSDQKAFKQTVLVPFPTSHTHTLAFVTGFVPEKLKAALQDIDLTVFVPTAPHPISGYLLFCRKDVVIPLDFSTEETIKFLLSCGAVYPAANSSDLPG